LTVQLYNLVIYIQLRNSPAPTVHVSNNANAMWHNCFDFVVQVGLDCGWFRAGPGQTVLSLRRFSDHAHL